MVKTKGYVWLIGRLLITFVICSVLASVAMKVAPSGFFLLITVSIISLASVYGTVRLASDKAAFIWALDRELLENRFEPFHLLMAPFILISVFALLMRELYHIFPDSFVFEGGIQMLPSSNEWLIFSWDQCARSLLLDFFETYKIHASKIDYTKGLVVPTVIFSFKSVLALTFWSYIISFFRLWNKNEAQRLARDRCKKSRSP